MCRSFPKMETRRTNLLQYKKQFIIKKNILWVNAFPSVNLKLHNLREKSSSDITIAGNSWTDVHNAQSAQEGKKCCSTCAIQPCSYFGIMRTEDPHSSPYILRVLTLLAIHNQAVTITAVSRNQIGCRLTN